MSEHDLEKAQKMREVRLDPLMDKSMGELAMDIPKRLLALLNKCLGMETAFRITGFACATWLVLGAHIEPYAWLIATAFLIFGKEALDTVRDIKK